MDSKHRHELMHNELADWIGKLPELVKEYRNQIIGVLLLAIGLISWPILNRWGAESDFAAQAKVTDALAQAEMAKFMAISSYAQPDPNAPSVNSLLVAANTLADDAKTSPNKDLAALALIKQGQTLRTELALKKEMVPQDIVDTQIKSAQEAYQKALDQATMPTIRAMAQFGLGLCLEELGQLEQAKDAYKKIVDDAAYAGTPLVKMAQDRMNNMADNNAKFNFVEAPKPIPAATLPEVQAAPAAVEPNTQTK